MANIDVNIKLDEYIIIYRDIEYLEPIRLHVIPFFIYWPTDMVNVTTTWTTCVLIKCIDIVISYGLKN